MADAEKITAYQGKLFRVTLLSHFGSTNVGWCLTSLPKGIALLAEEITLLASRPGAEVRQIFSFSPLDNAGTETLEFRLIKHLPSIGKEEQLETVNVQVDVVPYDKKNGLSKDRFVEYSENSATYKLAQDNDCTQVLKYGYPPFMKYGYPAAMEVSNVIHPYGYPFPDGEGPAPCPPVTDSDGVVRYKYGYPPAGTTANCEIVQDDCGCAVVKYGYPTAVKYGYPGC
jgi:hypothetical protein